MKCLLIALTVLISTALTLQAQCPPPGQVKFVSQAELDQFALDYPTCTTINGWIVIGSDWVNSDITSLAPLSNITNISSALQLKFNPLLTSLTGLNSLQSIGNTLQIFENDGLLDFTGLNSLTSISGDLTITGNELISNLTGLQNLNTLTGELLINSNPNFINFQGVSASLTEIAELAIVQSGTNDLTGLENIISIPGGVYFGYNNNLTSVSSLSNCTIGTSINATSNPSLTSLSGLEGASYLSGDLILETNHSLVDLQGLNNVATIDGMTNIIGNNALANLNGLNNLSGTVGQLYLRDNPVLTDISALTGLNVTEGICLLDNCPSLLNLIGLNNITSIGWLEITDCILIPNLDPLGNLLDSDLGLNLHGNASLTSIAGLSNITHTLQINIEDNDMLPNLTGLENLIEVYNGLFKIWNNDALLDILALNKLEKVGIFWILYNHALQNLDGLDNLHTIEAHLYITGNSNLQDIHALSNLVNFTGNLGVTDNDILVDLHGVEGITTVTDLYLDGNNSLVNLTGLDNLVTVAQIFEISHHPVLTDVSALSNLTSVGYTMNWEYNSVLQTMDPMGYYTIGDKLTIIQNPQLSFCSVPGVCNHVINGGLFLISGNNVGCSSEPQIVTICSSIALPVELTSFTAKEDEKSGLLEWSTASETNNAGFEVWKQEGRNDWQNIGWIDGAENSSTPQSYSFRDEKLKKGVSYYRIVQIDFDGQRFESETESVTLEANTLITLFPNPVSNFLKISGQDYQNATITIFDISGKEVQAQQAVSDQIDVSMLDSGYYTVLISVENETSQHKIIKL